MNRREQHEHSHMKLYVNLGNMDNAKLRYYQDKHDERWEGRQAKTVERLKFRHRRWKVYHNRFQQGKIGR